MNAQLAMMDRTTSLKLLRLLTNDKLAMGGSTIPSERLSRWIWGVLARLPDSGELNSEEIGLVRDLGKRAVWLGVVMNQPQSDTAVGMPGDEDNDSEGDYEGDEEGEAENEHPIVESEEGELENENPIIESEEKDISGHAAKESKEVDAQILLINDRTVLRDHEFLHAPPTTKEEEERYGELETIVESCFWDNLPRHIQAQFSIDDDAPWVAYRGHLPNPEIVNVLFDGNPYGDEMLRAEERLRNFCKRNRGFARCCLRVVYRRNPWAEQYDGPEPPEAIADGNFMERWTEFIQHHSDYKYALYGPGGDEPRDTADDEYGEEAFDRAWQVAGLDAPQTRVYDDDQDEKEEITMAKLGLVVGRDPRPAVVEEPVSEDKGEEETLEAARERILAQLGGMEDTNAAELTQARDALKEQEIKERAREDEEDAARLLNAKATIDMIITVAGEIYGQRDLLEFRETWD